jgi:hypothetical protein
MLHRICRLQDYLPSCWHVITRPNSYVRFDWSVIFMIRIAKNVLIFKPDPKNNRPIKSHIGIRPRTDMSTWWKVVLQIVRDSSAVRHLFFFLEPWDVRELYIRKTADFPLQHLVGTFPHFVAIGFYFLSETLIHNIYKSLHQSFFCSFITILPSESGVTLHYSTILP